MKPCFRILNPLLLHPPRCTPSIEPQSAKFLHTACQQFCQPSEPCSDPCFLLFNGQWRGGGGVGAVKCERVESMFNQELTPIGPHPNFILFNPLHKLQKFIHAAGDHHWSRQKYTAGPHRCTLCKLVSVQSYLFFFTEMDEMGLCLVRNFLKQSLTGNRLW